MIVIVDMNYTWQEKLELGHECIQSSVSPISSNCYCHLRLFYEAAAVHVTVKRCVEEAFGQWRDALTARVRKSCS